MCRLRGGGGGGGVREAEGRRGKERRKVVERVVACSYSTCSIVNLCQKIILTISVGNNILRVYYTALEPLIMDHSKQTPLYLLQSNTNTSSVYILF